MKNRLMLFVMMCLSLVFVSCAFHDSHISTDIHFSGFCSDCSSNAQKAEYYRKYREELKEEHTSQRVVFARYYSAFQRPKGIAKFPDGGRVKKLFQYLSVYEIIPPYGTPRHLFDLEMSRRHGLPVRVYLHLRGDKLLVTTTFGGPRTSLYDLRTDKITVLGNLGYSSRLSPDATRIAYIKEKTLFILDLKTGDKKKVAESEKYFNTTSWSSDARYIYIYGKKNELFRYDLNLNKKENAETPGGCSGYVEKELKERIKALPFEAWEKPTPLELNPHSYKRYKRDLIKRRGDMNYRLSILDLIIEKEDINVAKKTIDDAQKYGAKKGLYYTLYLQDLRSYMKKKTTP